MKQEKALDQAILQGIKAGAGEETVKQAVRAACAALPERDAPGRDRRKALCWTAAFLVPVLAVLLVFPPWAAPKPRFARAGGGAAEFTFAPDCQFETPETGILYTLATETGLSEELWSWLSEEGFTLIEDGGGSWSASREIKEESGDLPSDEEAKALARKFVERWRLWNGNLGEPAVSSRSQSGDGRELSTGVSFYPKIDGLPVYGFYRVEVVFWCNGEISAVHKMGNPPRNGEEIRLKNEEQIRREVKSHPERVGLSKESGGTKQTVAQCRPAYYADGQTAGGACRAYPVYVLLDSEGAVLGLLDARR